MKQKEPVSTIMTKSVHTLTYTNSLFDAEKLFRDEKIRHIPVVSGERLVGMISLNDLLRISFIDNYATKSDYVETTIYSLLTIEQVMSHNPDYIREDASIKEVAEILSKKEYHALPVVKDEKLVGIVTTTDLIKYLLDMY